MLLGITGPGDAKRDTYPKFCQGFCQTLGYDALIWEWVAYTVFTGPSRWFVIPLKSCIQCTEIPTEKMLAITKKPTRKSS